MMVAASEKKIEFRREILGKIPTDSAARSRKTVSSFAVQIHCRVCSTKSSEVFEERGLSYKEGVHIFP